MWSSSKIFYNIEIFHEVVCDLFVSISFSLESVGLGRSLKKEILGRGQFQSVYMLFRKLSNSHTVLKSYSSER